MRGIDINKAPLDEMETVFGKNLLAVVCDVANWREVIDTFEPISTDRHLGELCWNNGTN